MTRTTTYTDDAAAFIATGDSRETSHGVMLAIVDAANSLAECEEIWENGLGNFSERDLKQFVDVATSDGRDEIADMIWGQCSGLGIIPSAYRAEYEEG